MPKSLKKIIILFDFLEKNSFQSKKSTKISKIFQLTPKELIEEYKKETGRRTTKYKSKDTKHFEKWKERKLIVEKEKIGKKERINIFKQVEGMFDDPIDTRKEELKRIWNNNNEDERMTFASYLNAYGYEIEKETFDDIKEEDKKDLIVEYITIYHILEELITKERRFSDGEIVFFPSTLASWWDNLGQEKRKILFSYLVNLWEHLFEDEVGLKQKWNIIVNNHSELAFHIKFYIKGIVNWAYPYPKEAIIKEEKPKPKPKPKPKEEKKEVPKKTKIKEWDLSLKRFKSKIEQESAIEDITFIFENIIYFFSYSEKFEYNYLKKEQKYQIKYVPNKINDYLVSELDKFIERRIKERIPLSSLTSQIDRIMDEAEKIEPKKKVELKKSIKVKKPKIVREREEIYFKNIGLLDIEVFWDQSTKAQRLELFGDLIRVPFFQITNVHKETFKNLQENQKEEIKEYLYKYLNFFDGIIGVFVSDNELDMDYDGELEVLFYEALSTETKLEFLNLYNPKQTYDRSEVAKYRWSVIKDLPLGKNIYKWFFSITNYLFRIYQLKNYKFITDTEIYNFGTKWDSWNKERRLNFLGLLKDLPDNAFNIKTFEKEWKDYPYKKEIENELEKIQKITQGIREFKEEETFLLFTTDDIQHKMLEKIKPFFDFLSKKWDFPKYETKFQLYNLYLKYFGEKSGNNFLPSLIMDSKAILIELGGMRGIEIFKDPDIIYARLVHKDSDVKQRYRIYSDMDDAKYIDEKFEMLYWNFDENKPYKIYHIKYKIIIEDWEDWQEKKIRMETLFLENWWLLNSNQIQNRGSVLLRIELYKDEREKNIELKWEDVPLFDKNNIKSWLFFLKAMLILDEDKEKIEDEYEYITDYEYTNIHIIWKELQPSERMTFASFIGLPSTTILNYDWDSLIKKIGLGMGSQFDLFKKQIFWNLKYIRTPEGISFKEKTLRRWWNNLGQRGEIFLYTFCKYSQEVAKANASNNWDFLDINIKKHIRKRLIIFRKLLFIKGRGFHFRNTADKIENYIDDSEIKKLPEIWDQLSLTEKNELLFSLSKKMIISENVEWNGLLKIPLYSLFTEKIEKMEKITENLETIILKDLELDYKKIQIRFGNWAINNWWYFLKEIDRKYIMSFAGIDIIRHKESLESAFFRDNSEYIKNIIIERLKNLKNLLLIIRKTLFEYVTTADTNFNDIIWDILTEKEREFLLRYLRIPPYTTLRLSQKWHQLSSKNQDDIKNALLNIQYLTDRLFYTEFIRYTDSIFLRFYDLNIEEWWETLTEGERRDFLLAIGRYSRIQKKLYQSEWKDIPKTTKDRIYKNLTKFKEILLKETRKTKIKII